MACFFPNFSRLKIGEYIHGHFVPEKCLTVEYIKDKFVPLWITCPEPETIEYLESLWSISEGDSLLTSKIINNFTGYELGKNESIQNILYDIPAASGKSLVQDKIPTRVFSNITLDDNKVQDILNNYKITNEWLLQEYVVLEEKYNMYADHILSKRAIFIIGNSGSGKTGIVQSTSIQDFFASIGIINPVNIDYDTVVERSELFKKLADACDTTAFKRVYDILYSSSSNLPNIEERLANNAIKLGGPLLFHMITFSPERAQNLKNNGYEVNVLVYINNKDLSSNRYANAKKGLVKNLGWLTKKELVSSIDRSLVNSIYVTEDGQSFEELKNPNLKDVPLMQDLTHMFKASINNERNGFKVSPYNNYKFNNSIIDYKDDIYICAYRIVLGTLDVRNVSDSSTYVPSYVYSNGLYPEMWAKLYSPINLKNKTGLHIKNYKEENALIANGAWQTDSFIAVCLLQFKNNMFSLIDGTEKILYTQEPEEDPRLYRKSDGKIYMYYMSRDAISATDIANKLRPKYCPEQSCYFVIESQIEITGDGKLQVHSKRKFDPADPEAPKVLCLQSQIDHASDSGILFDKNYAPYSWSGQDYFGYSITKKNSVYKRGEISGSNIDCSLLEQNNMHPFFAKLFSYSVSNAHLIHSISQNSPAIQWSPEEYICVGHIRLQNFVKIQGNDTLIGVLLSDNTIENKSMYKFYVQEWNEYSNQEIFVHGNIYFMFFYTFNPTNPSIIKRISHCFIPNYKNRKFTLCFAMSLSFVEDRVCLTFGEGDVLCRSILMSRKTVEEMLFDIDTADPNKYKFALMDVISPSKLVPDSGFTALDTINSERVGDTMGTISLSIEVNKELKIRREIINKELAERANKYEEYEQAYKDNNLEKMKELIMQGISNWNEGLLRAVKDGSIEKAEFMLRHGADELEGPFEYAYRRRYIGIVKLLLKYMEPSIYKNDFYNCFNYECTVGGSAEIVGLILPFMSISNIIEGISNASQSNYIDIIKLLINTETFDLNNGLLIAVRTNSLIMIKLLIEKGAKELNTPLDLASKLGNVEIVEFLVDKGATNLDQALESACQTDKEQVMEFLIKKGANSKLCPELFKKEFLAACESGDIKHVKELIEQGATYWNNGLIIAVKHGHKNIVDLMLQKGANNFAEAFEYSYKGDYVIDIISLLLGYWPPDDIKSAEIYKCFKYEFTKGNAKDVVELIIPYLNKNINIFHKQINEGLINACYHGFLDIVQLLIQNGADNWNDGLINAIKGGNKEITKLMLRKGATNLDIAMEVAINYENIEILKFLITRGANNWNDGLLKAVKLKNIEITQLMVNNGASNLDQALELACTSDNEQIINFLIKKGANSKLCPELHRMEFLGACKSGDINRVKELINQGVTDWNNGLIIATKYGYSDIVGLMLQKGANNFSTAFTNAYKGEHLDIIESLIQHWPPSETKTNELYKCFKFAYKGEYIEMVALILKYLLPTIKTLEEIYKGFMHECTQGSSVEIVDLLIPELKNDELMFHKQINEGMVEACYSGFLDIVRLLIENGADAWNIGLISAIKGDNIRAANIMLLKGATNLDIALIDATSNGDIEIVNLLINFGAKDLNGALRIACNENQEKMVKFLVKKGADSSKCPKYFK